MIILNRLSEYLDTHGNQFGFKPKLGTDTCIYALKEIISSYSRLIGSVFTCFDRVKHFALFTKLIRRDTPVFIVRLLLFWYSHQSMCVRWGGCISSKFNVRQEGVLYAYLFILECILVYTSS